MGQWYEASDTALRPAQGAAQRDPANGPLSQHAPGEGDAGLPQTVAQALAPQSDEALAEAFTRRLAHSHYENFSVVSVLLPRHLRQDFCNVYAFCRVADDAGDEIGEPARSVAVLGQMGRLTHDCFAGRADTALFTALAATLRRHQLHIQPFLDLIDAFEQDQRILRYDTYEQVLDYCRRSADPVGRIVLAMCGCREERQMILSDKTCTALQLANFWQDVRRDYRERNRIYLPKESLDRFGVGEEQIRDGRCDEAYKDLIRFEVDRAEAMFKEGDALLATLPWRLRGQIALFGRGGRAILDAIRRRDYDTLTERPTLSAWQKGRLVLSVLAAFACRSLTSRSAE